MMVYSALYGCIIHGDFIAPGHVYKQLLEKPRGRKMKFTFVAQERLILTPVVQTPVTLPSQDNRFFSLNLLLKDLMLHRPFVEKSFKISLADFFPFYIVFSQYER
ncbi:hypothetical protein AVEN_223648-1 [Araneus ventricosus]|uniref:Uncharacterized protein n=1 Tax=Araneus ventricosus TaxID=182803 RepID=A0A4Y2JTZ0_ARAVE|nr:hypothetical protein AVEN_223648-1 [Araneus ventricosus]